MRTFTPIRCIHTHVNTRTRPSEVTHMDPICPLSDAVCMGAPVEPLPARIFTLQVFWRRGACGPMCQKGLTLFDTQWSPVNAPLYLGTLTLEIKTLHWIFSRDHVDHKTVPVTHGKTLWRSKRLCEVGPRPPHRGPATRVLTATFAMSMSGQAVSSHLTEASDIISYSSHRSDLSCTQRRTACLLSA